MNTRRWVPPVTATSPIEHDVTYDQFNYLVISSGLHFECQILEASPREPCLRFVLEIEPAYMLEQRAPSGQQPREKNPEKCVVSARH